MKKKLTIKDLEKRIEKIEIGYKNHIISHGITESKEPRHEYKVGDYVEFYPVFDNVRCKSVDRGVITAWFCKQNKYQNDKFEIDGRVEVNAHAIKGYCKDLLTPEEKEFLQSQLECIPLNYERNMFYIVKGIEQKHNIILVNYGCGRECCLITIRFPSSVYKNLELNRDYTLEELGL